MLIRSEDLLRMGRFDHSIANEGNHSCFMALIGQLKGEPVR